MLNKVASKGPQKTTKERGASLVEYALLVALIAVTSIVALQQLGTTTQNQFAGIIGNLGGEFVNPN